ncbi:MAG: DEAD/DEAH box helicase [Clostridiales bacterium]|nr:DEAD/DEAH box helicase [Clostridiales bacterium]
MITEDTLLQLFNEETSGKRQEDAHRVIKNDLVANVDILQDNKVIVISGNVISENLFNEYTTKINFDTEENHILSTYCSCDDFQKFKDKKKNYCCKHLNAVFYKSLEALVKHPLILNKGEEKELIGENSNILNMLLSEENIKTQIKIEVYINKDQWDDSISFELKIGSKDMSSNNLYCLKDINQFLIALEHKVPIYYGKNFTFSITEQYLTTKDKRLIDFIYAIKQISYASAIYKKQQDLIEGKYVQVPSYMVRDLFNTIEDHRVYLNEGFFHRPVETEILREKPPVDFDLKIIKDNYVLKSPGGMPLTLGSKNDVFLYGTIIYLPDYDFCYKFAPYIRVFNPAKVVTIPVAQEEKILRNLIPQLNFLSSKVTLSKIIESKIVSEPCGFNFYFDMEDDKVILKLKVKYGQYEFNIFEDYSEKVIYRDLKKEKEVKRKLNLLGFQEHKGRFYLMRDDEYIFNFFKKDIIQLQQYGEVYYSENFRGIRKINANSIVGTIKSGKYDYFEMDFKIGDLTPKETTEILRAFRDNLKYYKLKDGEYLDLEQWQLKQFLMLINALAPEKLLENKVIIPTSKAPYVEDCLKEQDSISIEGRESLAEIKKKLIKANEKTFMVPKEVKAILRNYQKEGYNWLKTLDYLGFGGILADEMGLGKTLQTISFILSNKTSKTLIIAPTSLLYNWLYEFQKFAPQLRVATVNGNKEEREEILNHLDNFDVFITTYNLLKRDLDVYRNISFDYCVIDEAQNIKNGRSQNALAVKSIQAKRRFALTGTPVENSLMDLWSILDFVMPGFLFDEKTFSVRYHKKLREEPEVIEDLNKLIRPFILKRKKKDVIKELPDKIEKILTISLDDNQKKVYKAYRNHALELIKKKVKEEEFKKSKIEVLSYITKLRQICLDPSLVMEDYKGENGKLEVLIELLHNSIEGGHKILVFSQFTSVLKNIANRLKIENIQFSYLDGSTSAENRIELVKDFNEGENSVFLISLKAGGTGLNLTSADIVIHYDPWWNPAVENQATDRAHRIGQKKVVEVIKIIAKGTIEEKILSLQEDKKKLISQVIEENRATEGLFSSLSEEEIIRLLEDRE